MKSKMIVVNSELDLRRYTMEEAMDGWSFIVSTPGRDTHSIFGPDNADKEGCVFSGKSTASERLPYHLSR